MKAPVRLMVLDCTVPKSGIFTALQKDTFINKAKEASALNGRQINASFFRPEDKKGVPVPSKDFDALIIADSSHTPTRDFMNQTEPGKMFSDFVPQLVKSEAPSLCISFGMEVVAASFGVYPRPIGDFTPNKQIFNAGYYKISTSEAPDPIFTSFTNEFIGAFMHRFLVPDVPAGGRVLARMSQYSDAIAAFRMRGHIWCVQWRPDHTRESMEESIRMHKAEESLKAHKADDKPLNGTFPLNYKPEYEEQNSRVLDSFLRLISR